MEIQTFYPVFENGQVLTSEHLNDIVDYLEPQDRLTRTRLTGIGVVCGFRPEWDAATATLTLSCGAATTSEGYLIAENDIVLDRFRPYTVPIPSAPDTTPEEKAKARYPFLFDGNDQREAFELLPDDFELADGEAAPAKLTQGFIADKTVMLFLECNLETLKNCDVNDCSDKGSEMNVTLRRLLVTRTIADKMLIQEAGFTDHPVDRASHPRLGLAPLAIGKINLSGQGIVSLDQLLTVFLATAGRAGLDAMPAMRDAFEAYKPLLADMFPQGDFSGGPIPKHHFLNMLAAFAENPFLGQYLHAGMHDIVRAHNEFIECAARFDAECCPDPRRFPKHVLLGDVAALPTAFAKAPATIAAFKAYDALAATTGPAPEGAPAPRRHHFVPSPALDAGLDKVAELRALFSRLVLLAQTYATRGLLDADIRLTPSRDGAAPLGERAIPFYHRFAPNGDLLGNWSWPKARANLLGTVHAYQFSGSARDHPFLLRQDEDDFIRIEGAVGKPLGTAMARIIVQKQALGLSFAIEPVWIGSLAAPGAAGLKPEAESRALALRAVRKLLLCRMRDLDVIFLMIMAGLFAFLVWLVQAIGRIDATKSTTKKPPAPPAAPPPTGTGAPAAGLFAVHAPAFVFLQHSSAERSMMRRRSDRVLTKARADRRIKKNVVHTLIVENAGDTPLKKTSVAMIYLQVRDISTGGELADRIRAVSGDLVAGGDRDEITASVYPAVSLLARAEEMMKVTSVASIAEFDPDRFGTAFRGFADAYESYAVKAELDEAKAGKDAADTNAAIVANRGALAGAAAQFSGAAIMEELGKRLEAMFADLTLPGFARKHPGMEHKGGVPVGGTFVLLYGAREEIQSAGKQILAGLNPAFGEIFAKLIAARPPEIGVEQALTAILASSKPQSDDVLDQFVVLADFCLPYLCCDAECSDVEVTRRLIEKKGVVRITTSESIVQPAGPIPDPEPEPEPEPEPAPGGGAATARERVRRRETGRTGRVLAAELGTITGNVVLRQEDGRERPFKSALLKIVDAATRQVEEKRLTRSNFELRRPAGIWFLVASSARAESKGRRVELTAGGVKDVKLVLVKRRG